MEATSIIKPNNRVNSNRDGNNKTQRPLRPEEIPIKLKIDEESRSIDAMQTELNTLKKLIAASSGDYSDNKINNTGNNATVTIADLRSNLDKIQAEIDQLEKEKVSCIESLEARNRDMREKQKNVNELKSTLGFKSEHEIDLQIRLLEQQMITSSVSLKQEKQMMAQIAQLQSSKASLEPLQQMEAAAAACRNTDAETRTRLQLDKIRSRLNELKQLKRDYAQRLYNMNESKRNHVATLKGYYNRKREVANKIKEHLSNRVRLHKQLEELNNEYYTKQKLIHQQKIKQIQLDREKRNLQVEIKQLQNQLDNSSFLPYDKEIRLLNQVLVYIDKLTAPVVSDTSEKNSCNNKIATNKQLEEKIQGTLLTRKQDDDVFLVTPKLKVKKNRDTPKPKILKLDMATMSYFEHVGVVAPTSMAELPEAKTKLLEKLEHFKRLQSECDLHAIKLEIESKLKKAQDKLDALEASAASQKQKNNNTTVATDTSA